MEKIITKKPIVVVLGNHEIAKNETISFDTIALSAWGKYSGAEFVCVIDNTGVPVYNLCEELGSHKDRIIKDKSILKKHIQSQMPPYIQGVLFKSSLKRQGHNQYEKFCTINPAIYRSDTTSDVHTCACWGLVVVMTYLLWEYYEKVVFLISTTELSMLKMEDALKAKIFFSHRNDFELIFAK